MESGSQRSPGTRPGCVSRRNPFIIVIDMKTLLPIVALLICVWPTGAFADNRTSEAPGEGSRQKAAVSRPDDAPGARSKVFIHPDTGEILTHEQWQALGLENDEAGTSPHASSDTPEPESAQTVLQGRRIDLGNGDYAIVVDAPEPEMVKTKVWFDEKGKAHLRCDH